MKVQCRWCNKSKGIIKYYIIADDLENSKLYHPACIRKLQMEVMMKLSDINLELNNEK